MSQRLSVLALALVEHATAHGYLTAPISRQYMSKIHYQAGMPASRRYDPESSELAGACGANGEYEESTSQWDGWYKAAGVDIPRLVPGQEFEYSATLTVDHGGQSWLQIACADSIGEDLQWTLLERAPSDRNHHILPSNPAIYAWSFGTSPRPTARYVVPHDFHCPSGRGVGRWLWKTGNSCTDHNNIGTHSTESFSRDEWCAIVAGYCPETCHEGGWPAPGGGGLIETFLSCFDFVTTEGRAVLPPTLASTPVGSAAMCCWSKWGDETQCGSYPVGASGGHCSSDGRGCALDSDCAGPVPPTPQPTPQPLPTPVPAPTPVPHPVPSPVPPQTGIVGYYSWNWGKGSTGPPGATHGVAFAGLPDVQHAIDAYIREKTWCSCPPLHGIQLLDLGGGNSQGAFSTQILRNIVRDISLIKPAGYDGVMFDVEEVEGDESIVNDFAAAFAAAKGEGLQVHVTTSHSAPYKASSPAVSVALVKAWVTDSNIDVLSPQLYSTGKETRPEFAETNFCKAQGCTWELYRGTNITVAPSLAFRSHYDEAQRWFSENVGLELGGFFEYAQTTPTLLV